MEKYNNLLELLKEKRPHVRINSIQSYILYLQNLHEHMFNTKKFEDLKWLINYDKVIKNIDHKSFLTKRNILNAIIVALMAVDADKDLLEKYSILRNEFNQQYLDNNKNGVKNVNQEKNMLTREELDEVIDDYGQLIKVLKIIDKDKLTIKQYNQLQLYVILRFHQHIALRNDLASVIWMSQKDFNKLTEDQQKEFNIYIIDSGKLILNHYKTSSKYGMNIIDIPDSLNKLLRFMIKKNPHPNPTHELLLKSNGTSYSKGEYSNLLTKFFKRTVGKSIGTTILRKIYLEKYSDVLAEMKEDAKIMGHSLGVQQSVYIPK